MLISDARSDADEQRSKAQAEQSTDLEGQEAESDEQTGSKNRCHYLAKHGWCKYGSYCKYGCAQQERYQSTRREWCYFQWRTGWCKYGDACRYKHRMEKHTGEGWRRGPDATWPLAMHVFPDRVHSVRLILPHSEFSNGNAPCPRGEREWPLFRESQIVGSKSRGPPTK